MNRPAKDLAGRRYERAVELFGPDLPLQHLMDQALGDYIAARKAEKRQAAFERVSGGTDVEPIMLAAAELIAEACSPLFRLLEQTAADGGTVTIGQLAKLATPAAGVDEAEAAEAARRLADSPHVVVRRQGREIMLTAPEGVALEVSLANLRAELEPGEEIVGRIDNFARAVVQLEPDEELLLLIREGEE